MTTAPPSGRRRVAIVGSGITGLAAAYRLQEAFDVVVFEASARAGGHIHAVAVRRPGQETAWVDTGFLAWSPQVYPNVHALIRELGVDVKQTTYPVVKWDRASGQSWLLADFTRRCGLDLDPMAGRDLRRLIALLMRLESGTDPELWKQTVAELIASRGYHRDLVEHLILPSNVVVWGFQTHEILGMSAGAALGLMRRTTFAATGVEYYRFRSSTQTYLEALVSRLERPVRTGCPVHGIDASDDGVRLETAQGTERFDAVLLTVQPSVGLPMLRRPTPVQRELLAPLRSNHSLAIVHEDTSLLPANPAHREAYVATWLPSTDGTVHTCSTWNMSFHNELPPEPPILVTISSVADGEAGLVDPARVHEVIRYNHTSLSPGHARARERLAELEQEGRLYFAGSWLGEVGSHECALTSALDAADRLRGHLEQRRA